MLISRLLFTIIQIKSIEMAAMGIFYHNPRAGSDFDVLDIFNFLLDCRYLLLSFVGLNFLMPLYV